MGRSKLGFPLRFSRRNFGKCKHRGKAYNAFPERLSSTRLTHWLRWAGTMPVKPQSLKLWRNKQ